MTNAEMDEVAAQARRVLLNPAAVAEQLPLTQLLQLTVQFAHLICSALPEERLVSSTKQVNNLYLIRTGTAQ